ncbi:hypothetical protein BWI15_30935 [Kribbella sp. ALI-6-A]|uniref:hypothetical protein n=1 Tax=Kribbella sp. ALI-6-A TaxID=1933817 RepID=UPI00097BD093|nr:hypothetical protein [Kribbella sp. ALI-6-A]ONI67535.1 hypothetical protein BWI15_30935 [Kribbella sp. ALI-6-A]
MNSAPVISGYELGQRLLEHPLAEIWRGRSFTGMEVVVLVLSEAGAADPAVRERLGEASRTAALGPGREEVPLWAANLTATRPYAVTQLVPGQSGAERLIDPLDGLLGNDQESLAAVRNQLAQYGAAPIPVDGQAPGAAGTPGQPGAPIAAGQPSGANAPHAFGVPAAHTDGATAAHNDATAAHTNGQPPAQPAKSKPKTWLYLVAIVLVLAVFSITYSIGAAVRSATAKTDPVVPPPAPVSPSPMPTGVLVPGIDKVTAVPWSRATPFVGVAGAVFASGAELEVARGLGLPFEFGFPDRPVLDQKTSVESSSTIYRRVLTGPGSANAGLDLRIAVQPCRDQAACLAARAAFDQEWTTAYKAPVPATPRDGRTWYTVDPKPYTFAMTHVFSSQGRWWLAGAAAVAAPGQEQSAQKVVNDIWRQTG